MINDQCIGDHQIERTINSFTYGTATLTHPVADDLATAEGDLITIDGKIFLDLNDQVGIC